MNSMKFLTITELMTSYNFEIEDLPDNLKCAKCKLVLKDACQVPCGCRFCRICIDIMMDCGDEFCTGVSEECPESPLSLSLSDYRANKSVSRLTVKCANNGCVHECQLANMEEHLRECQRKSVECPFRQLGCKQDKLPAEDMDGHLQHENRRHSEILIGMVANMNREIEMMKQREEESKQEIETMKQKEGESKREIDMMKRELVLKNEQISTIIDRMTHVENDNKSMAQEKADLIDRVRILSERIDREIDERRKSDELDGVSKVVEHVDKEIAAITAMIGSNKDEFVTQIKSVKDDIRSLNQGTESIKHDMCSIKSHVISIQAPGRLEQIDARCDWLIDDDVEKASWGWPVRTSDYFIGAMHPYKYRLSSYNNVGTADHSLRIHFRVYSDVSGEQVSWPFEGRVIITVADREKREACRSISRQCRIERPPDNECRSSDRFVFLHSELIEAELDPSRGVRVLCEIVPNVC